jgi:uncharacterized protein (TIGR02678 family)
VTLRASEAFNTTASPELQSGRRRALRALLRNPLLSAGGETAEKYLLVRRHSEWLKQWLTTFPAWSLHIDKEVARLRKIPADVDETRPATDRSSGTPFTRHRYALLCLALATLEKMEEQTTLGQIAQTIMELSAGDPDLQAAGLVFDIGNYDKRRDLVHAVRLLVETGVLRRRDGNERQFLDRDDSSEILYDINRYILSAMLQGSRSPSAVDAAVQGSMRKPLADRARSLGDHPLPAGEDSRLQRIRSRLVRSLLDDPILYFSDLNDEERKYLERHRGYLIRQVCEATGLIAEVRAEGIAMVDDTGDLVDLKLPEEGTMGRMSLVLVQWCAGYLKSGEQAPISVSVVEEHIRSEIRFAAETGAEIDDALVRLKALRLIRMTPEGVVPMAACGRYAATAVSEE